MGWSIGFDLNWNRDIGYGVPATCDHPGCGEKIDRGLANVCSGQEPYGGEYGCGLYFCSEHHSGSKPDPSEFDPDEDEEHEYDGPYIHGLCAQCASNQAPFVATPDHPDWINWKLNDPSWQGWRDENPVTVALMHAAAEPAKDAAQ